MLFKFNAINNAIVTCIYCVVKTNGVTNDKHPFLAP